MTEKRWLRIIPVALIMYTISYVDRTNISLALTPKISSMMRDLMMDDEIKGRVAGIFFIGYVLFQIPGGYLAQNWSAKKVISIFLVAWGLCAVGCGLTKTSGQFTVMRFFLGVAESGVYPATLVLLAHWFPRAERARANAYWCLCQPLAVVGSAPITSWLLKQYGWQAMLIAEGALPFLWLPIWLLFISDHPAEAKWISREEREFLETTLQREATDREPVKPAPLLESLLAPGVLVMIAICFLYNAQAYGCMTFFTAGLSQHNFSAMQYGLLFALPYAITAVIMVLNSWHSDKTQERRGHIAVIFIISGASLITSVSLHDHFWISYALLCLAIPGPFSVLGPFFAIPSETMPSRVIGPVIGLVNALGNVGGFVGPNITGWLTKRAHGDITIPFAALGIGMLIAAILCIFLPKSPAHTPTSIQTVPQNT
jgi:MFS family permease